MEYGRFGWDDPTYNIQTEERVFRAKSMLAPADIKGKLVLDAGCGNGRYTYWAARLGGNVIGVDLGDGVESAARNTAHLSTVQIVQGDIFNLPFRDHTFDIIFSIGVLMHTGNAHKATASLARTLMREGKLTVHLYGKGNILYEWVDAFLRKRTTCMTIPELQRFTERAFRLQQRLERLSFAGVVNRFVRLDEHPHCIFDWYAAPIATHHTYGEVEAWFPSLGLQVTGTKELPYPSWKKFVRPLFGRPITVTVQGVAVR